MEGWGEYELSLEGEHQSGGRLLCARTLTTNGGLHLRHYLASKGGGTTSVSIYLDADSFDQIAELMLAANRNVALAAFAKGVLATAPEAEDLEDA